MLFIGNRDARGTVVRQPESSLKRRFRAGALIALAALASACGVSGQYVWFHDLPKAEWGGGEASTYVIGLGDTIHIQVYEQEGLTATTKIRPDGRIALPFVGEIVAAGKPPANLARELEARLKEFIVSPRVTVNVEEAKPVTVNVLGEAARVGALTLEPPFSLLQAISLAGGPTNFADRSAIFVLRRTPEFKRIRFTYDAIVQNEGGAASFTLRTGDVIVVE